MLKNNEKVVVEFGPGNRYGVYKVNNEGKLDTWYAWSTGFGTSIEGIPNGLRSSIHRFYVAPDTNQTASWSTSTVEYEGDAEYISI